ncbi:nicotinamidase-related amidase [Filimonas zeae]|uniref:Hydrolase n=1 Tax=Filimonas zeae TaxID=1737353 RepID=A0A917IUN2_9BACT|nr:hydrolase [Filimonas zeae]MDR6339242.1 nicotinamidase-related amidase [Filimonas zeae]GGH64463.1 hydrolase [Filimonas zeae]
MSKNGLEALLTPDNCALILIDHQPFQFAGLRSHDTQTIINNVVGLAKSAKAFGVPVLLSTVLESRGGFLLKQLQEIFPDQKPIDRTFINTWEDARVIEWVKNTGKKKIVMAALWTEICLAMPVIQALGEGYEVYIVTDASGGVSLEAHEMAVLRMVHAGAVPITWTVFASELQRDWARTATVEALGQMLVDHMGNVGTSLLWEQQLLATEPVKS